jgi:hypothetical protein
MDKVYQHSYCNISAADGENIRKAYSETVGHKPLGPSASGSIWKAWNQKVDSVNA